MTDKRLSWKRTMTRYGLCLSCKEGTCIVHAGGDASRLKESCGRFLADGHKIYDPTCGVCIEANSDAPEWTI